MSAPFEEFTPKPPPEPLASAFAFVSVLATVDGTTTPLLLSGMPRFCEVGAVVKNWSPNVFVVFRVTGAPGYPLVSVAESWMPLELGTSMT